MQQDLAVESRSLELSRSRKVYGMGRQLIDEGPAMSNEKITYRLHAVQRMFERKVST